jgi:pyruvate formate lyase activating enzyme
VKEAFLYEKLDNKVVHCRLCAHQCRIRDGAYGVCGVRQNRDGVLYSLVYGKPVACNVDPIEKKPLYHFLPGSFSLSIATPGCNFRCGFCQNWEISQSRKEEVSRQDVRGCTPEAIVEAAVKNNCGSISYTYTEPTVYFEYAYETARLAKKKGLYNIFVTNGYMSGEALEVIRPFLDAVNVDLKFFRDDSYRKVCGGSLQPVLDSIALMKKMGMWVEVTTLVVPGQNDSAGELRDIARFIAGVDRDIPWHISRFYPNYQLMDAEPTSELMLKKARELGVSAGLNFIYAGNVYGWGNDTYCPRCEKLLIRRRVFDILENKVKNGACFFCGENIAGVFHKE